MSAPNRRFGWHSGKVTAKEAEVLGSTQIKALDLLKASARHIDGSSTTDTTAQSDDVVVGVDTTTNAVTVTLPSSMNEDGRVVVLNDEGGNAGTNAVTIDTEGSENVDGSASTSISGNYNTQRLYSDGSNWFTF